MHKEYRDEDSYQYRQLFDFGREMCELTFLIRFNTKEGVPSDPVFVLDEDELSSGSHFELWFTLGDGFDPPTQRRKYLTCDFSHLPLYEIEVVVANGDQVRMDVRATWVTPCPWGEMYCEGSRGGYGRIIRAVFVHGQEEQAITGDSDLVFTSGHHLFDTYFLLILEEPVGTVHSLFLRDTTDEKEIQYLDDEFNVIDSPSITSWEPGF